MASFITQLILWTPLLWTSCLLTFTSGHAAPYHPSMYGWSVVAETFGAKGDFRPHTPLDHENFDMWWFHGHLNFPPKDGAVLEIPAGGSFMVEIACHKGATSYWRESEGSTDIRTDSSPCPGSPSAQWHAVDINDVTGCAFAISDKPNVHDIQPEDFSIFTVNHRCVWDRETHFQVPEAMPACPGGICHCAWFWIHSSNSGSQQMYMNGYKCKVTGADPAKAKKIMKPQVARRCGADPLNGKPEAVPSNCTVGAKQPLYWYQNERNNMFEGTYAPPVYNALYDFKNGAQNDIFLNEPGFAGELPTQPPVIPTTTADFDLVTTTITITNSAVPALPAVAASSTAPPTNPSTSLSGRPSPSSTSPSISPNGSAPQPTSASQLGIVPSRVKHCKRVVRKPNKKGVQTRRNVANPRHNKSTLGGHV